MKICLINNLYKPYNRGGTERIVEMQADGLTKAGHEVFIISTKPIFGNRKSEIGNRKLYYLPGFYYNLNRVPKFLRLPWHLLDMFDLGNYFKIKSILKKAKPDVVITHNLKGIGYLIPKAIKCLKIKHIHILHDIQLLHPSGLMLCRQEKRLNSFPAKIYINLCRYLFGSPDIIISPSKWLMKLHEEKNFFSQSKKIILFNPAPDIYNSPLLNSLSSASAGWAQVDAGRGEVFRFLYVGQIEKHKGILFLIKVFNLLCEDTKQDSFQLLIAGHGSKIREAKKSAANNKAISFLGQLNQEGIKKSMQNSNCLIVPSLGYENSPTVIYEAAAAGLPVMATRLGGIPELIHELGGILFEPGNEGSLKHQMKWATSYPARLEKIRKRSKEKIKKFQLKYYIKKLTTLL